MAARIPKTVSLGVGALNKAMPTGTTKRKMPKVRMAIATNTTDGSPLATPQQKPPTTSVKSRCTAWAERGQGTGQEVDRVAVPREARGVADVAEKEMLGGRAIAKIDAQLGRRIGHDH